MERKEPQARKELLERRVLKEQQVTQVLKALSVSKESQELLAHKVLLACKALRDLKVLLVLREHRELTAHRVQLGRRERLAQQALKEQRVLRVLLVFKD
jgi:hypothetical protein